MLIKVTNFCSMGCTHCMEDSTVRGGHMTTETVFGMKDNELYVVPSTSTPVASEKLMAVIDRFPDMTRLAVASLIVHGNDSVVMVKP